MKQNEKKFQIPIVSLIRMLGVIVIVAILSILNQDFLTFSNIINILRQSTILVVLTLGITCVLLTAGIDLSVGGVMALVGCLTAQLLVQNVPIPIAIAIGLAVGAMMGAANGFLVGIMGIPAFVATYGMMWIAEGLAHILMQGRIIFGMPKAFLWIGAGYIWKIPVPIILSLVLLIIFHILLNKTVFGRNIFALGSNRNAAYYSGIRTKRLLVQVYALSGLTAAIAGMIMTARINAAEAGMGGPFSMQSIAAVVIGGTSLLGGEGGVIGSVMGALILTLIVNGLNLLGVSSLAHSLITGVVIIAAVYLDILLKRKVVY
jgi:ribose transport system permease protein